MTEIILKFNYILRGKAHCGGGKVICMFRIENIFLLPPFCQKWRRRCWKKNVILNFSFILFLRLLSSFDHWYCENIYISYNMGIGNRVLHWNMYRWWQIKKILFSPFLLAHFFNYPRIFNSDINTGNLSVWEPVLQTSIRFSSQ